MGLKALSRHLYLRIWLAVVVGVAVLMLVVGWAWRVSVEHNMPQPMPHDWVITTPDGQVLGTSAPRHDRSAPLDFVFTLPDGRPMQLHVQRQWEGGLRRHTRGASLRGGSRHPMGSSGCWA